MDKSLSQKENIDRLVNTIKDVELKGFLENHFDEICALGQYETPSPDHRKPLIASLLESYVSDSRD